MIARLLGGAITLAVMALSLGTRLGGVPPMLMFLLDQMEERAWVHTVSQWCADLERRMPHFRPHRRVIRLARRCTRSTSR